MGTPTPSPPIIGANCAKCDGVLWPAGETPLFAKLTFADIEKCPASARDPPDGEYILEQVAGLPCSYLYEDDIYWITFGIYVDGAVRAKVKQNGAWWWVFQADWNNCDVDYVNSMVGCLANEAGKNGTAHIDFEW